MKSSAEATMSKKLLPEGVEQGMFNEHVLPTLKNHSIIDLGKLCDMECEVLLKVDEAFIYYKGCAI